jgi:hypothetical protein
MISDQLNSSFLDKRNQIADKSQIVLNITDIICHLVFYDHAHLLIYCTIRDEPFDELFGQIWILFYSINR